MFKEIEAHTTGTLKVSDIHEIYYEESGNPHGHPIVFFHGGPGGGTSPIHRQFYDPQHYRILMFDQRGAGKSNPSAETRENTTWDLLKDIERLREMWGVERWVVSGGSWGSTLALLYAIHHPERVEALILRGIFLCRPSEIRWFYQHGAHEIFPDAWEAYSGAIPPDERGDLVAAYKKRLTSSDPDTRLRAARAWSVWEVSTSSLLPNPKAVEMFQEPQLAVAFACIENHYFTNNIFLPSENYILENVSRFAHIPGVIVQGRYDVVCPTRSAWDLSKLWKNAELKIVPDAGHSMMEPGIAKEIVSASERFKRLPQ